MIYITPRRWLLLPIDIYSRELHGKMLLSCFAAERGWGVLIGSAASLREGQRFFPRGLLLEKSVTPAMVKRIRYSKSLGNCVSAWSEEGLIYYDLEDYRNRRLGIDSFSAVDYYFAWGERESRDIKALVSSSHFKKVVMSGNPRIDILRPEWREVFACHADRLREKYAPMILVNTKFALFNNNKFAPLDYVKHLRAIGKVNDARQEELMLRAIAFQEKTFFAFKKMVSRLSVAFPECSIIIRPHPSESHAPWTAISKRSHNVKTIFSSSANAWMLASDVVVQNNCTTGVEAFLLNKPVISFRPIQDSKIESDLVNNLTRNVYSEDALIESVVSIFEKKSSEKMEQSVFFTEQLEKAKSYLSGLTGPFSCNIILNKFEELPLPEQGVSLPLELNILDSFKLHKWKFLLPPAFDGFIAKDPFSEPVAQIS